MADFQNLASPREQNALSTERNAVAVRPHLAGATQRVPQIAQLEPQVFDLALDEGARLSLE
jgi:hypothetical protein